MSNKSRFLLDSPLAEPGEYRLNRLESHHAVNVLRHRAGDVVVVFDGTGAYADAVIEDANKNGVRVSVAEIFTEERLPLHLTIATAMPKGKRWQVLVEKCTELGVDRIIPLLSERSVVKGEGDVHKWRRWAVEAAKQSRRAQIPEVIEPLRLDETLVTAKSEAALLFIADPQGETPQTYRSVLKDVSRAMVIIGPEGGLSERELDLCRKFGAKTVCLSPFTLRIETAAATVCALVREVFL